jgi:hypothetical protein
MPQYGIDRAAIGDIIEESGKAKKTANTGLNILQAILSYLV